MNLPKTPSFRLDGKRALVVGGSSGIGLGAVAALAEAGAHVVIAARSADKLTETVTAVNAAGYSAESVTMDISQVDSITDCMRKHSAHLMWW